MRSALIVALLVGCGGEIKPRKLDPVGLSCVLQDGNALRIDCIVDLERAATVQFTLTEPDRPDRVWEQDVEPGGVIALSGLAADTVYGIEATGAGLQTLVGEVRSGRTPEYIPEITVSGVGPVPYLLIGHGTVAFIVDELGRVVWYEDTVPNGTEPHRGLLSGYDWTGDGVVLHITSIVRHIGIDGTERLRLERGTDFDRPLHHALVWSEGRIFSLNAGVHETAEGPFTYDGFYAFDETGLIGEWDLYDHTDQNPPWRDVGNAMWDGIFGDAIDVAHGNGIFVTEDDDVLVSLRTFGQVWKVGGVGKPDAGEVRWILDGQSEGDFAISSAPGVTDTVDFTGQHFPRMAGNRLTLVDNRGTQNPARTLAMELDEQAGTAEIVEAHDMALPCPWHSSTFELANGNTLATCTSDFTVFEFAAGSVEGDAPIWSLSFESEHPWLPLGVPIEEPPASW